LIHFYKSLKHVKDINLTVIYTFECTLLLNTSLILLAQIGSLQDIRK